MSSRLVGLLTWLGAFVSAVGAVDLIWTQIALGGFFYDGAVYRWQQVGYAVTVIALGVLVSLAAQLVLALRSHRQHEPN